MDKDKVACVIRINISGLLTRSDYETVYNILFARRMNDEPVNIRNCVNRLAIGTRTKMTLKEDEDKDCILIFWRYYSYLTTLPTFKSDILSVYDESDREYKRLNKDKSYLLIGTNNIRTLSPPELMYLKKQINDYIDKKKRLGEIEDLLTCKN